MDRPKVPRFHAVAALFKNIQYLFKNMFDLLGFTYVLGLSTIIQALLRFHHRNFPFLFKTFGDTNCFKPNRKTNSGNF